MQEKQEYLETKIKPIMENLIFQLVSERPDNPSLFMIDWLQKTGGYNANNLTHDEKKELEVLRMDISKYREMEGANLNEEAVHSEESEEEEEKVENLEARKKQIKGKGPRIGVSAEAYGQFNKKEDFKPRYIKKNENQIARIKSRILQSFIFTNLDQKDVGNVIGAMEEKIFNPGEAVIRQGEQGDCLFVVESGDLECFKRFTKDAPETFLKKYTTGDSFGELALLYNAPRAATILAKTKAICWALDRETFNNIVKDAARKKREKYETFLRSVPILESIEDYELTQVCDALKSCSFKEGDYVIREVKKYIEIIFLFILKFFFVG
jgi:cAMP-dependent protein kinase regulator